MKQKGESRIGLWISVLLIFLAAGTVAYFAFLRPEQEEPAETPAARVDEAAPLKEQRRPVQMEIDPPPSAVTKEPAAEDEEVPEIAEPPAVETEEIPAATIREDECAQIERDVRDFFSYLDEQDYVRRLLGDTHAWSRFTRTLSKLSHQPPIPAGEGLDPVLMTRNIYHLFRVLDDIDILLTKEVIHHEADTIELNMDIFYRWLTLGDQCPDPEKIRPSKDVLYRYAGFFMNTIGGRSYLFRRSTRLRLLISYYTVLVLHDADREGINAYGIDVLPLVRQVREDIERHGGYYFQDNYLKRLAGIEGYYLYRSSIRPCIRLTTFRTPGRNRPSGVRTGPEKTSRPIRSSGSVLTESSDPAMQGPSTSMNWFSPMISLGFAASPIHRAFAGESSTVYRPALGCCFLIESYPLNKTM